jgi:hypothetical protein
MIACVIPDARSAIRDPGAKSADEMLPWVPALRALRYGREDTLSKVSNGTHLCLLHAC